MLASEIIKQECCGVGLSLCNPKAELVKKVETMENEIVLLNNQLNNALKKIQELENGGS